MGTKIGWTDETWNPVVGCTIVSPGCAHCYAMKMAHRLQAMAEKSGKLPRYLGTTKVVNGNAVWTGKLGIAEDAFGQPFHWKKPRRVFVNSMSDLFHPDVPIGVIDRIWGTMATNSRHTFQILTKRADRMRDYSLVWRGRLMTHITPIHHPTGTADFRDLVDFSMLPNPLPNVHLGVSTEDQDRADERIPALLETNAEVRFISYEPALGPVDLVGGGRQWLCTVGHDGCATRAGLDWVICGSESGAGARVCDIDWIRRIRDQCVDADIGLFWKQHAINGKKIITPELDGRTWEEFPR